MISPITSVGTTSTTDPTTATSGTSSTTAAASTPQIAIEIQYVDDSGKVINTVDVYDDGSTTTGSPQIQTVSVGGSAVPTIQVPAGMNDISAAIAAFDASTSPSLNTSAMASLNDATQSDDDVVAKASSANGRSRQLAELALARLHRERTQAGNVGDAGEADRIADGQRTEHAHRAHHGGKAHHKHGHGDGDDRAKQVDQPPPPPPDPELVRLFQQFQTQKVEPSAT